MHGVVTAVSRSATHTMTQAERRTSIRLLAGLGVEGDAHLGETVKHRSRVARDPSQPNLRQVHLIHAELHDELRAAGFDGGARPDGRERHHARHRPARAAGRHAAAPGRRRRWSR